MPCRKVSFSYNNVLIERYVEDHKLVKRVYLPAYANYEEENGQIWKLYERLGYEVIQIYGLDEQAVNGGGSLRCMTKALNRQYIPNHRKSEK